MSGSGSVVQNLSERSSVQTSEHTYRHLAVNKIGGYASSLSNK